MPRAATLIQRALRAVGLEVRRLRRGAPPPFAPLVLSRHLEGVDVVLDVGANVGQFGRQVRQHGYTGRIVSFEPQHDAYRELCAAAAGDDAWECVEVALGEREGELTLHIAGNSKASSLLEMTSVHVDVAPTSGYIGEQPTVVRPLDALDVLDPRERVCLKLDTQGYELAVLRGAERTLHQVAVVQAELLTALLYEGQAWMHEVIGHLADRGFRCVGMTPVLADPRTTQVVAFDGVFVR